MDDARAAQRDPREVQQHQSALTRAAVLQHAHQVHRARIHVVLLLLLPPQERARGTVRRVCGVRSQCLPAVRASLPPTACLPVLSAVCECLSLSLSLPLPRSLA